MIPKNSEPEIDLSAAEDSFIINSSSICGAAHALPAVTIPMASQSNLENIWDQLLRQHHYLDYDGMITVDSSEFAKKGAEAVGVARQSCGSLGEVDICQSGVFLGYSSEKGYGLLTGRLYIPESWFAKEQEQQCSDNPVPEEIVGYHRRRNYVAYRSQRKKLPALVVCG